jgi:hypothetical protein
MAQVYSNGAFVPSNKSIFEVVVMGAANGAPISATVPLVVTPKLTTGGNLSVTTNNSNGSTYTAYANQVCSQLTISNDSLATNIDVIQGGSGAAFEVLSGTYYTFFGLTNANQISVRRNDQSTTPIVISARWES